MGTYTTVDNAFWTDPHVTDNFTPEDKYFYLYLLTNTHVNLSGCFEVSLKQIADEMGYSRDSVERLIGRFTSVHKVIDYDKDTKEILIHNWAKYHWTTSDKYLSALRKKIDAVKSERFSQFLNALVGKFIDSKGTVYIPYQYGMDTSVTVTDIYNISINNNSIEDTYRVEKKEEKKEKTDDEVDGGKANQIEVVDEPIEVIDSRLSGCSPELISAVETWLEYKKEKRQSYKEKGYNSLLKTIVKNAEEFGDDAVINAIEQTMANGYQGIVWDYLRKQNYRGRNVGKSFSEVYEGMKNARVGSNQTA